MPAHPVHLTFRLLFLLLSSSALQAEPLIRITDVWRLLPSIQLSEQEQTEWPLSTFDDSAWPVGVGGFVDSSADGRRRLSQATRISNFGLGYHTLLFRRAFDVEDPALIQTLMMRLQYVHGLVLWVNGQQVFQSGFQLDQEDEEVPFDAFGQLRQDNVIEEINLDHAIPFLKKGRNVVAAQVHAAAESRTFSFVMELMADFVRDPMVHQLTSHSALLSWKTAKPVLSTVRYGLTKELNHSIELNNPVIEPEAKIESLIPGARYYYRVELSYESGLARSGIASFRTPDPQDTKLKFAVLGDSGRGTVPQYEIAHGIRRSNPDLVIHTGDVVYPSLVDNLVDYRFFSIYGNHMRGIPYYLATGNHDRDLGVDVFAELFHMPVNPIELDIHLNQLTTPESYFTVKHGPAQFFVLYAPFFFQYDFSKGFVQHAWLESELKDSDRPWKFFVIHHPMRTSSLHWADDYNRNQIRDILEVRNVILPLAQQYGVQAILSGHDHVYERFQPDGGVFSITTAGGGGGLYPLARRDVLSSQFRRKFHFVKAFIDGNECQLEAVDDAGNVLDTFYLSLPTDAPSRLRSTWHTPTIETGQANDLDGNIWGQQFDFHGEGLIASPGEFSHAGKLFVNHDENFLFIGFRGVILPDDGALYLFLGQGEEINELQSTTPGGIRFDGWNPSVMAILGDEFGDGNDKAFHRSGFEWSSWQGVFQLDEAFTPLENIRLQQYNINPQATPFDFLGTHLNERNADYIELAIPFESLPSSFLNDSLRLTAITGLQPNFETDAQWVFDTSSTSEISVDVKGVVSLKGLHVDMTGGFDTDQDGLSDDVERQMGTKIDHIDSDADGLPDGWEVQYGLAPLSSQDRDGRLGDPDGDGLSNWDEWMSKTDPSDVESKLAIDIHGVESEVIQLSWTAMPGIQYTLEQAIGLNSAFSELQNQEPFFHHETESKTMKHHVFVKENQQQFFRVVASRVDGDEVF